MNCHRVLIVEDNKAVLRTLDRMLTSLQYETVCASSMAEVRALLAEDAAFSACLLDYCLPDAPDGETLPIVLEKRIPTVVLTARNDIDTREKILALPVVDYIPKDNPSSFEYALKMIYRIHANPQIKVLVVDDSLAIRGYLSQLLRRHLYQVLEASNAVEALALLRDHPDIRLTLLDHDMPGMNGVAMSSEVRRFRSNEDVAIIGISASQDPYMSARFLKAGADDYLNKPFNHEEFFCRITRNVEFVENLRALSRAAHEDPLTGLHNRRSFFDQVLQQKDAYGVAMIDIDFFKHINDAHGHFSGDEALRQLATQLRTRFDDCHVARFGGEEFAILIPGDDKLAALRRLEDCRKQVAQHDFAINEQTLNFTLSIGFASSGGRDINQLLKQADESLYRAKQTGRNRLCFD